MHAVNAWIIVGFIVLLGVVGYWKGRTVKTTENFMVAGRSLGFVILFGTLMMSEYNIGTMIGYTRFGYTAGLWGAMLALICFSKSAFNSFARCLAAVFSNLSRLRIKITRSVRSALVMAFDLTVIMQPPAPGMGASIDPVSAETESGCLLD